MDAVNADLQATKGALDEEVSRGEIRDATLMDHEARIQLLRDDANKNTENLNQLGQNMTDQMTDVNNAIQENKDSGDDALNNLKA